MDLALATDTGHPISLIELLSNSLILYHTAPYLPISALLALGATSKSFNSLVHTPGVFRYLDATSLRYTQLQQPAHQVRFGKWSRWYQHMYGALSKYQYIVNMYKSRWRR